VSDTRVRPRTVPTGDGASGPDAPDRPARGSFGTALALPAAAAATTWWAMLSWSGFTARPSQFLVPLALVLAVVALAGAGLRWARTPGPVVVAVQVVGAAVVCALVLTGQPLPGAGLVEAVRQAAVTSTQYAAPVPATPDISIRALLLVGGALAGLLLDLVACTLRRVPLAGIPLLVVYSVPVSILGAGPAWWVFGGSAGGFLLMLYLQERRQVRRWGRALDHRAPHDTTGDGRRRTAVAVGAAATVAALLAPLAVPTVGLSLLDLGTGGDGDSDISIDNPTADLRRNLTRPDDVPLLDVRTDDPDPSYLRISVLNRFTDNTWSSGDRAIPTDQVADGALPPLEGVDPDVPATEHDYEVSVAEDFDSRWLPTQAPVSAVDAEGDWRFDTETMDFLAGEDDLSTAGLDYTMTAVDLDYSARVLDTAAQSYPQLPDELTRVPEDLPAVVGDLAREVTAEARTPYEQAAALQQWYRRDGGFEYSLDSVPERVGVDELETFLDQRVGYCQQFAASMAVMARTLGIPARVAVGFLTPEQLTDDTYRYSAFDLHSWPELYFPGSGWVRFDPTPAARVGSVPGYSRGLEPRDPGPTADPTAQPSTRPSTAPTGPVRTEDPTAGQDTSSDVGTDEAPGFPWGRVLVVLLVLVAATVAVRLPGALRVRRRAAREADGGPEACWAELRDSAIDLGVPWPEGRSPREVRGVVTGHLAAVEVAPGPTTGSAARAGDDEGDRSRWEAPARPARGPGRNPEADDALARLTDAVERSRYARHETSYAAGTLVTDLRACRAALQAGAGARARRRARWLPASVLPGGSGRPGPAAGDAGSSATGELASRR